jgi:hypothetical protein
MHHVEPSAPELPGVVADAEVAGLENLVIGGFSVIYHGYIRATKDSDLLVPDGPDADAAVLRFLEVSQARRLSDGKTLSVEDVADAQHLRVDTRHGIVDILRGGLPPLDYATVSRQADAIDWKGQTVRFAALPSVVGFKRLAGRPQDKLDLSELEALHGKLPIEPIPGIDT